MRTIRRIFVHHSASARTTLPADVDRWHADRGWSDEGYHYYVRQSPHDERANIWLGRPVERQGAHVRGHNEDSIGVCCLGDYSHEPHPESMRDVLLELLALLCRVHGLEASAVYGHREASGAATECPGRYVHMTEIRAQLAARMA